jgi:cobyrinic acid a,c-diamide synthase
VVAVPDDLLRHHGDVEARQGEGLVDLAVNVFDEAPPDWLGKALAGSLERLEGYPESTEAAEALAGLHGRGISEVLPTAGAAEAFTLVARMREWRRPVVVHPQFTEPDVALGAAGHRPQHVILRADDGFRLDPAAVPSDADLVIVGNPTNPTGIRHPASTLQELIAPGRVVVVDEAFNDDGEESLAGDDHDGLIVIRSLTKLWALPGLRAGYLLADPSLVESLRRHQAPWSVSTPAAAAMVACASPEAVEEAARRVRLIDDRRVHLVHTLTRLGVDVVPGSTAPFVLVRAGVGTREALRARGFVCRRGDTFPGLGAEWLRIAVRAESVTDALVTAWESIR